MSEAVLRAPSGLSRWHSCVADDDGLAVARIALKLAVDQTSALMLTSSIQVVDLTLPILQWLHSMLCLRLLMPAVITILIRATTRLHIPPLLIHILTLLAPLRRLILPALLLFVSLLLGLMHSLAIVLRWAVDSHKLQWLRLGGVNELVLRAGWDYHDV